MRDEIIKKIAALETVTSKFEDVIGSEAEDLRKECGILSADEMQSHLSYLASENRLLNIGIIGRVKAGKSSLLNSIFFDGKSILPKAATPMTASLTAMTHGDVFSATVEYFTEKDIETIKKEHDAYSVEWEKHYNEKKREVEERAKKRGESPDMEKVKRQTDSAMKDNPKYASYDQYELMGKYGSHAPKDVTQKIEAASLEDLLGKLNEYVGSKGRMMPYTKSAEIRLPIESLRDICVVDTPGINDPVKSREARTEEYLKKCDVVFIISSAGQFISGEDMALMDNLSTKEAVGGIYLVASQVDNQIYGSVMEESNHILNKAIETIHADLSSHAASTLTTLKNNNPEIAGQFDQLIEGGKGRVMLTSAMCHAMSLRYNERASWDEDMNHVWGLLNDNYKDYFDNDSSAKANLDLLSGVNAVGEKIALVRNMKDGIIADKQTNYTNAQAKNIDDFSQKLKDSLNKKIERINNTDIASVREQKKKTETLFARGSEAIDGTFDDCIDDFKTTLRNTVSEKSKTLFAEAKNNSAGVEQTKTEIRHWTTGILFWKKDHSENYEIRTLRIGAIKSLLNELVDNLQDTLVNSVEDAKKDWKKSVQSRVTHALTEEIEDVDLIDITMLKTALRRLVNNMELPDLDLGSNAFNTSHSGTIEDDDIDDFMEEVQTYMSNLRMIFNKARDEFIQTLEKTAKREKMSDMVFSDLRAQLETLEKEINNKELTLDRLNKCAASLNDMVQKSV